MLSVRINLPEAGKRGERIPGCSSMLLLPHSAGIGETAVLCYHIHHILQTLPHITFFCLPKYATHYVVAISTIQMTPWQLQQRLLPQSKDEFQNSFNNSIHAGTGALQQMGIVLKLVYVTCKTCIPI